MSQLTEKQMQAREYYQRNKDKICAQKRAKYSAKSTVSPSAKRVFNTTISPRRSVELARLPKAENPEKLRVRRRIEDVQMARDLGISLNELGAL